MRCRALLAVVRATAAFAAAALLAAPVCPIGEQMVQDLTSEPQYPWVDVNFFPISVTVGDAAYFFHSDGLHGRELWRSDGTAAGTRLVRDVCPGACGIESLDDWAVLAGVGGRVLFAGDDGVHGQELWITDGTAPGTRLVTDLRPGPASARLGAFHSDGTWVYFSGDDGVHGLELWRSDGTAAGTTLVAELVPGAAGLWISAIQGGAGLLYLLDGNAQIWRTDGTQAGTFQLGAQMQQPIHAEVKGAPFRALPNGVLVFQGCDGLPQACELWRSDGTLAGTYRLADLDGGPSSSWPTGFFVNGNEVWFTAWAPAPGSSSRYRLFRTDGTAAGTALIPAPLELYATTTQGRAELLDSRLVFVGFDEATGSEPWITDGTLTARIADLRPGPESSVYPYFSFDRPFFARVGSSVLFLADAGDGAALWRTGGAPGDPAEITDFDGLPPGSGFLPYQALLPPMVASGRLVLPLWRPGSGQEIWSSDGTQAGTGMIALHAQGSSFAAARSRVYWDSGWGLCFAAGDRGVIFLGPAELETSSRDLYYSDGTPGGIRRLAHQFENPLSAGGGACAADGDYLFAFGGPKPELSGLWVSEGSTATTELLVPSPLSYIEFAPSSASLPGGLVVPLNGFVYALQIARPGPLPEPGAGELEVIPVGQLENVWWGTVLAVDARVFFAGSGGLEMVEGTNPPLLLVGAPPGVYTTEASDPTWSGTTLFFSLQTAEEGTELWKSDGTPAGTVRVADLRPGPDHGIPQRAQWENWNRPFAFRIAAVGSGRVVFVGDDGVFGAELWSSDGTGSGTQLVVDLAPGARPSTPRSFVSLGSVALFLAEHPAYGLELFRSDGTADGTGLVRDIVPGRISSQPDELVVIDGIAYFSAWTPSHGREAWRSDGTALGTYRITDAAPGPLSSSPSRFARSGDRLFFVANDNVHGFELWALDLAAATVEAAPSTLVRPRER